MGLFGWGDKKEKEKKEKADREHAETRRRMEESVQKRRAQTGGSPGVAPASTTVAAPAAAGGEYTVKSGDSLSKIAQQKLGDGNKWRQIYDANRAVIGDDPDLIKPGQRLRIPG
jgi:nucleoid-associated protein YgaU